MNGDSVAGTVKALQADARRLGLTWQLRPATAGLEVGGKVQVILDGDSVFINAVSLIGSMAEGSRVMAMLVPPAGVFIIGGIGTSPPPIGTAAQGQIAYAYRDTASTASAAARPVLRLDEVKVYAGRRYEISTNSLVLLNSAAVAGGTNTSSARLSYEENGALATTSSQLLPINNQYVATAGNGSSAVAKGMYVPGYDTTLSILLFTFTAAGVGLTNLFADPTLWRIELWVNDVGASSQLTGTTTIL